MIGRLGAKAILLATGVGMAFFGVGLLGFALASSIVTLFGVAGATAIAGAVLLLPPLFWAMARLAFKPKTPPPPPPSSTLVKVLMAAIAKETPWMAIVGAGVAGAVDMFLNRNKPKK
jgi:hypothetical protein